MVTITKMECAEHLLYVACEVYDRYGSCPAVVHLAGASAEMAAAVVTHAGAESFFESLRRHDAHALDEVRDIRNWVKHADRDPEGRLDWHGKRYGNTAYTSELLLYSAAKDVAIVYGRGARTTRKAANALRSREPELASQLDDVDRKLLPPSHGYDPDAPPSRPIEVLHDGDSAGVATAEHEHHARSAAVR